MRTRILIILTALLVLVGTASAQKPQTVVTYPVVVGHFDATAQSANLTSTTLYAVPATAGGIYRVSCHIVVTQAATTSSSLPQCNLNYTDKDTNGANPGSPIQFTIANSGNAPGISQLNGSGTPSGITGNVSVNAKGGTNILVATVNYASSGATAMQYAVHFWVEYLGPQ